MAFASLIQPYHASVPAQPYNFLTFWRYFLSNKSLSRRAFLRTAAEGAQGSVFMLTTPAIILAGQQAQAAMEAGAGFVTLDASEATEFAAIAARIIPSDETAGADEAGVIYFIDRVLGAERAELLQDLRSGLAALQQSAAASYGGADFSTLTETQQDLLLQAIDDTAFFNTVRYLTIAGMFASPALGGNRDRLGWQLLGFEDRHAWMPPYGYYDAQQMERED